MSKENAIKILNNVLEFLKLTPNQFSRELGIDRSQWVYDILNPKKNVGISKNKVDLICSRFPQINRTYLMTGEGSIENWQHTEILSETSNDKRPRIPATVQAGTLTEAISGVMPYDCEYFPIIHAFPKYDFTFIVKGDSMEPKYEGGDEIACKRIDDTSFIQWGKPHVLDTSQGLVLKRIYEDGNRIRCVSYNPEYPDFSISKEEVFSINLVVGLIRV